MWREARALFKIAKTNTVKNEESIREGYELIVKSLELDDRNVDAHKWYAIIFDAKNELDGIKTRIAQLGNVRKHMERAVELNPEDPSR